MGWTAFVGARHVMNEGELREWMEISKSDEKKRKTGKNMRNITKH